jgi:hypothetical protein
MERKKRKRRSVAATRVTDEKLIKRLGEEAPEVLDAQVPEALFDAAVEGLLKELPEAYEKAHFYCRRCGRYHLKSHPHRTPL